MPESDLDLLIDAAKASGAIARRHFKASPEIWEKSDGAGPVTEADLEIDRMLRAELLSSRATYGWLSEETEDDAARLERDRVFIIDPIDGTRTFIAGEKSFAHSLAIAENGRVTTAVVYLPLLDLLYTASETESAQLNGETITTSAALEIEDATVLAAKPNLDAMHWVGAVPSFTRKFRPSLAYRLCLVAQGRYDGMLTLRDCWEWDIAAGDLIVRQAGGRVTDRHDDPLVFNSTGAKTKGCHAAGKDLHTALQARLRQPAA
ncbi:inositol monophosphatase family protein [Litoreibacter roseus]|uniref:3'(2'),5'-bisphosphate nucleotidase CysQ n=1 Tax=Litoreibacter roseus TaxID=2601869 RepID=A0A6N6JIU2_9RHOB|nr:3'(2'),5'-bisphosphate nucleotidase CysQ [Litoreibacter roseus]GFE66251.1 3'(2'),5'-bisphosphate nucleotidase CysQ [Litoreibacter roseus]